MERIIKSREILDSIKEELAKLEKKIAEFAPYNLNESFIPIDLCTSTSMTLQKLSAYEESLFEKLAEFSDTEAVSLADAEKILKDAEVEMEKKLLVRKFSGIKTNNPKYDSLIEQLKTTAVEGDLNSPERTIADMLVSDLLNNTTETAKNELVENSSYYKLAFAFNRNELYYVSFEHDDSSIPENLEPPVPQGAENTSSDNSEDSESQESSDSSDGEPEVTESPPDPYYSENHSDEIFIDIDLDREEDFNDDNQIALDLSLTPETENSSLSEDNNDNSSYENDNVILLEKHDSGTEENLSAENEENIFESENELSDNEDFSDDDNLISETEENIAENALPAEPTIIVNDEIRPIVEEYGSDFEENPNEITLSISESPEVNTKHNVTEIINMLSPKGRSARYPVKVFQVLMSELLLYGPKTEDDLYELPDFLKNRISNSIVDGYLEKLYNKGLISRINYDGNVLYYFTKKGLKFNNHDRMISNFYCCSDKRMRSTVTKRDCRKVYPISNISVCSSVILSKIVKKYPYYLAIGSSDIALEGLSISVISKPNIRNFALAYVSDDAAKLDKLYENLNRSFKALHVFEKLDTLIIGSFTLTQSEAVYKIVEKSWEEKLVSTRIVLYSYIADKYYEPDTLEEFTDFENSDELENVQEEPENIPIEKGDDI